MRHILLVLSLYFSFLHLTSAHWFGRKCRKANGNVPKPGGSCRSYYKCRWWRHREMECPSGEHFFPERGHCVDACMYPCFGEPQSKECPFLNGKFLKPNTRCVRYYECCNGVLTEKGCMSGLLFNRETGRCDWASSVTCAEVLCYRNPCKNGGTCSIKDDKMYCSCRENFSGEFCEKSLCDPNPCNNGGSCSVEDDKIRCLCREYFFGEFCDNNQCDPNPCHNNGTCTVEYGKVICSCDDPFTGEKCEIKVKTERTTPETITEPITEVDFFCPDSDGFLPHPTNKHKFIACVNGLPSVMDCPGYLVYDHKKKACDYDIE